MKHQTDVLIRLAKSQLCAFLVLGWATIAIGAESTTELELRGLVLTQSADALNVSLESETLVIGPEWVTISYRLVNQGTSPATLVLTIPLPELDFTDPDVSWAIPDSDPVNFIDLSGTIAGKPAGFSFTQVARAEGKDVTAILHQLNVPLIPNAAFGSQLSSDLRQKLIDDHLVQEIGNDVNGNALLFPKWTVQTQASRKYLFQSNQAVNVDLRYRTSIGFSPDTFLRKALRNEPGLARQVKHYKATYCIDDAFYVGLDKISSAAEANSSKLRERRIVYKLVENSSEPPIKEFRLVVDKGRSDRVVSFCIDNLKRISSTAFEMRAVEFKPSQDLKILMVGPE
jgi:hypothetical protein